MNVKQLLTIIAVAILSFTAFSADGASRKKHGKPTGGFLEMANTGKVIQVINKQSLCSQAMFDKALDKMREHFHFPIDTVAEATAGKRDERAAARIVLVDHENAPILLCAPEDGWCELNVRPLFADAPNEFSVRMRLEKEMLRALCYALGCGNSSVQPCVMCEVDSLQALDRAPKKMGPDAQGKTLAVAMSRGAILRKFASYRRACQEGWAPAPTNDIQKAIWDEVHALPTNPIKILPETKPVKD